MHNTIIITNIKIMNNSNKKEFEIKIVNLNESRKINIILF